MVRWIAEPGLSDSPTYHPLGQQIAARTLALAYISGTAGERSAAKLAARLKMDPNHFRRYTVAARREFGIRNPHFAGHGWKWGRRGV